MPDYVHTTFFNSSTLMMGPAGWEGWEGPPGAWTVTIGDLVRLMMAIQNDDIISPATRTQMMTVHSFRIQPPPPMVGLSQGVPPQYHWAGRSVSV